MTIFMSCDENEQCIGKTDIKRGIESGKIKKHL